MTGKGINWSKNLDVKITYLDEEYCKKMEEQLKLVEKQLELAQIFNAASSFS